MPKFSANLNFLYPGLPFLDRLAAAASDGFRDVEIKPPFDMDPGEIRAALAKLGLRAIHMNAPAGNEGESGLGVLDGRDKDFDETIATAIRFATALDIRLVHVMSGVNPPAEPRGKAWARLTERFQRAADAFRPHGVTLLVEHINPHDKPGYFVSTPTEGLEAVARAGRDNVRLQFDIYHAQRMAGDVTRFLRDHLDVIGHIQIADNPGRRRPGTGEINFPFVLAEIDRLGYTGWVGLEYIPDPSPGETFGWMWEPTIAALRRESAEEKP